MPLSVHSIPTLVRSALRARGADFSNLRNPAILAQVGPALRQLGEAGHPQLRKTFTATAVDGEAPLTALLAEVEPLILTGLRRAQVYIAGFTHAAQWKADRSSLAMAANNQFAHWTLEGLTILIRDAGGLNSYDGPVTIRNAPYVPLLANVPTILEPLFIDLVITRLYGDKSAPVATANSG